MGKEKYQKEIENLFKKSFVVDVGSVKRIVKKTGVVKQYTKQLIRNMILKGKIKRLTKGYYTLHNDISLAVFCFKPAYFGLQDAISFHNLWEQETIPVIITARRVRPGIRKVLDANVMVRRINKKYFFGFDYFKEGNFYLPYSDLEKTFIDMVYFKEKLSKEAIKSFQSKIDRKKLKSYLKVYSKRFRQQVLVCL